MTGVVGEKILLPFFGVSQYYFFTWYSHDPISGQIRYQIGNLACNRTLYRYLITGFGYRTLQSSRFRLDIEIFRISGFDCTVFSFSYTMCSIFLLVFQLVCYSDLLLT
jgi:hypothetical protein